MQKPEEEGSLKVHVSRSVRRPKVTTDGRNLVSHAGAALLAELADRTGLTAAMSEAMSDCGISWHTHDPGVVLTHIAVAVADGADCLSDMAVLREQAELFGPVASLSTAWRALEAVCSPEQRHIKAAVARARERAWAASPPGDSLVIDFDATLVTAHSDKQDAAPTYKHGFGFHPLASWCDTTAEPVAAMLRPGNAGSNSAADHLELLDETLAALPPDYRAGHEPGDDPSLVKHPILVRADSAGATHDFVRGLREANVQFSIGHQIDDRVRSALFLAQEEDWGAPG
jgi:Transposase DDE domain group 1